MRILAENTSCIVIDYQEKILPAMSGREELVANSAALLKGLNLHFLHMKQKRYMKQWIKSVKMS